MILHGLKSCERCRRARRHLEGLGVAFTFSDLRENGVDAPALARWTDAVGWERLLNRRSATWRQLPAGDREGLDRGRAIELMAAHPTLIKRPVLEHDGGVLVSYRQDDYEALG